jgi:hypothetical protein
MINTRKYVLNSQTFNKIAVLACVVAVHLSLNIFQST